MIFDEEMKVIYHSDIIATTLGSCTQRRITKAFSEMSRYFFVGGRFNHYNFILIVIIVYFNLSTTIMCKSYSWLVLVLL